jgi:RNA polymerase sigma-70 factor, ECF subfamily
VHQEREFDTWYRSQHRRLVAAMSAIAGDVTVGTEVADEAFVRALERWDRVATMASPEGWLYRTALNHLRRTQRRVALEQHLLRRTAGRRSDRVPGNGSDWHPDTLDAIAALPNRQRKAVALHYVADLSVADTARIMGIVPGTVMATLHAARATLSRSLRDDVPADTVPGGPSHG